MSSFGRWICLLELDTDEHETAEIVADLKARLGDRVRTTTKERWLYDEERKPARPPRVAHLVVPEHSDRRLRQQ